jgi:WD40 repeat protein
MAQEPKLLASLKNEIGAVQDVAFSPDGKTLALACADPFGDRAKATGGTVVLWDVPMGKVRVKFAGHTYDVKAVTFSKDGKMLASSSGQLQQNKPGEVMIWDPAIGKELLTLKGHKEPVWSLAFSPDGETLATGSTDRTVKLWNPANGKLRATLEVGTNVFRLAYSDDGKTLVTAGIPKAEDHALKLWDVATGKVRVSLGPTSGERSVYAVAFSPDKKTLASYRVDKVELYDLATGKIRTTFQGITGAASLAFSKDGGTLAVSNFGVDLWDVATGKLKTTLKGHSRGVSAIRYSPDGELLATASSGVFVDPASKKRFQGLGGELKLWKVPSGK